MSASANSIAKIRDEFPLVSQCVYLSSNSMGVTPRGVEAVLSEYWSALRAWRDSFYEKWWIGLHEYADALASLIGAAPGSVVTDANLSALMGRFGTCFDYKPPRTRIITSDLEFPTTQFIWRAFGHYGAELVVVPSSDGARIDEDALCAAIDERTLLVCISHATFSTGALVDLKKVAARARSMGALLMVDAYQSVGAVPVDVVDMGVDVLLGGAHKWMCGSLESGFMYVRPDLAQRLEPAATGWMGSATPLTFGPATRYAETARRFMAGTPAVLPALISRVGLDILQSVGVEAVREASLRRTARIMELADKAGMIVVTPREPAARGGVVCLRFPGDHGAPDAMDALGFVCTYRGAVRVAPHFYNTDEEVERFMEALVAFAEKARR